ncbi:hypothetical protein KJ966_25085 [bacterium]|nr:hypothetical protein [bacterium]
MNTVQTSISTPDKLKVLPKSQLSEKRKDLNSPAEQTATQAKSISKLKETPRTALAKELDETSKDIGEDKLEVNEYLKMVSRLENKLNQSEITDEDLDKITSNLEERILELSEPQKKRLRNMELFKKKGIDNLKEMKKSFVEMFKSHDERDTLFEFLKSPEFMGMLLNEQPAPVNYASVMNQNQLNSITA